MGSASQYATETPDFAGDGGDAPEEGPIPTANDWFAAKEGCPAQLCRGSGVSRQF